MLEQRLLMAALAISVGACDLGAQPADEQARTIEAMRPPKRARPVIAVIAQNEGTETTDFLIPYAVLKQSEAADVIAVAPRDGAIRLTPALAINAESSLAEFDARYPDGADYVVVPKIEDAAHPVLVAWIQAQAAKGSTIVGICSGVKTVAAAGLVDGRNATGHWYDLEGLREEHPTMTWVRDRRYVVDRGVMTTTGVSASLPASLALVEAFAGRQRAAAVATELGVSSWDTTHDSSAFSLTPELQQTAGRNQQLGKTSPDLWTIEVDAGVDEIALGFTADAWSRTMRSKAIAVADDLAPIVMRRGLELVPEATIAATADATDLHLVTDRAATALPISLAGIADHYDRPTAAFVALQLEYAWKAADDAQPRHGSHDPVHGGLVMMDPKHHVEIVLDPDSGQHRVYVSDDLRAALPASTFDEVTLTVADQELAMTRTLDDTAWQAAGDPVPTTGAKVSLAYAKGGQPVARFDDLPIEYVLTGKMPATPHGKPGHRH